MNLRGDPEHLAGAAPRVVVHDFAGHPFQIELSRELAARGWRVDHQYSPTNVTGHGEMRRKADDPEGLTITEVSLRRPFARYRPIRRLVQEIEYAVKAGRAIRRFRPDVVLTCNLSLLTNVVLVGLLRLRRTRYVFWHQDVYSAGIRATADKAVHPWIATVLARVAEAMERAVARHAEHVVAIADSFTAIYRRWELAAGTYSVIPNWAVLDDLPVVGSDSSTPGRAAHTLLYAGTLGLKHDPGVLLDLATSPDLADTRLVVVSEGKGRDWLELHATAVEPGRLELRDYVPFAEMPALLGSADVLLAILEPAASRFSVPSKVLTYLCAGRPVVAVMEPANAAAVMVRAGGAGIVVAHEDVAVLPGLLRSLLDDPAERARLGTGARLLAERTFDRAAVADRFEAVLEKALAGGLPIGGTESPELRPGSSRR